MPAFENKGEYLLVTFNETYSLDAVKSAIQQIADFCATQRLNKALVDLSGIQGEVGVVDRYEIGVYAAKVIGSKVKVAAIARPGFITYFVENVLQNRGGTARVFTDEEHAREWLEVG